jgi:hypothetical protein
MQGRFQRLVSIELSHELCAQARRRFRRYHYIEILCGHPGKLLPDILHRLGVLLRWFQSSSPFAVMPAETTLFLSITPDVFTGLDDYPSLQQVHTLIAQRRPDYDFCVRHVIIRVHPKSEFCSPL